MPHRQPSSPDDALHRTLSHGAGVLQHPLPPADAELTYPTLTSRAPPTDAFQETTPTGLVSATEAEADLPATYRTRGHSNAASLGRKMSHAATLARTISRGTVQRPLSPEDGEFFPSTTSRGAPSDAYQEETATGIVSAIEAEGGKVTSGRSSMTAVGAHDAEKGAQVQAGQDEAKLVTWLENDPENPRNFGLGKKWVATVIATLLCFSSGLGSSIVTGGLEPVWLEFNTTEEITNATVAMFVVGFGIGPMFWAPLSEMYGRRIIYLVTVFLFFVFTIPCAVAPNIQVLVVFRLFAGLAASAPMTNAAGTIADVWSVNERGHKMAAFSSILFASPCLGPPIGGYIAEHTTWRWIYWVLLIFIGVTFIITIAWLPETYAPTLLGYRAKALRKEMGDDTIMTEQERNARPFGEIVTEALLRPLLMLTTEVIMICFSGYLCLIYGLLYGFFFAYPIVFAAGHGFSYGQTGLTFFGILIGIGLVAITACPLQENYYQRKVIEGNGSTPPETRLPLMMGCALILPCSLFIFAWTSPPEVSWVGPCVSGIPFGFSLVGIYISANSYLIDAYGSYGASAMAAKTLIRSLAGASVPMWINYHYARLGNAWAGSLLAFIAVAMCPIPFAFYWYGERIRGMSSRAS